MDFGGNHRASSLPNPAECSDSGPVLSDERGRQRQLANRGQYDAAHLEFGIFHIKNEKNEQKSLTSIKLHVNIQNHVSHMKNIHHIL